MGLEQVIAEQAPVSSRRDTKEDLATLRDIYATPNRGMVPRRSRRSHRR